MPLPSSRRLRVAVIGAGLGSAPHFHSLRDLAGEAELVYVYGRSAERLAAVQVPAGARKTTRLEDILEDAGIEAVLVLTPPNTHLETVQRLARAGKHVLVEKPLEIDLNRANALVEACEQAGVTLAVMLQHRLREAAVTLRALIASGELGQLVSASAAVRWWRPQSYYDEPGRGTLARDGGGVLITQAIHTLDLLLDLIGMPARVTGTASTSAVHRMEGEDTAAALLHYDSGAVAILQATTAAYPGFPERLEFNFTRGTATLEGGEMRAAFQDGRSVSAGGRQASGGGADPMAFDHAAHKTVLQDFIRAVKTGTAPAVSGRSALGVQQVIEAVMASSRSGAAVALHSQAILLMM
ncbi:Gfo/Idh/MocA family protein [Polaromonas sp. JS666]|uniref:Gfo/Idh/MocA family protein n=1 Tax=Polaromonas sp. (strain JS666 / ATCC BAA-500) TaxID=296591 RepID=UPI0008842122|nr:Gfo/Idh/MocA family oxidoreductase [Polaromonas sp. JS666]SDM58632.1 Predicted dehydrogenase [Polaromonas sp. JS666]